MVVVDETTEQPKLETMDIIARAEEANRKAEENIKRQEELLKQQEQIAAKLLLGGRSGVTPPTTPTDLETEKKNKLNEWLKSTGLKV